MCNLYVTSAIFSKTYFHKTLEPCACCPDLIASHRVAKLGSFKRLDKTLQNNRETFPILFFIFVYGPRIPKNVSLLFCNRSMKDKNKPNKECLLHLLWAGPRAQKSEKLHYFWWPSCIFGRKNH